MKKLVAVIGQTQAKGGAGGGEPWLYASTKCRERIFPETAFGFFHGLLHPGAQFPCLKQRLQ